MICMQKQASIHKKINALVIGLGIATGMSSLLVSIPMRAADSKSWSENHIMKAIYFDRSSKQRAVIIAGVTIATSTLMYLLYKLITRTSLEKNLMALDQIEQAVKEHYWARIKTEEVETKAQMPSFKKLIHSYEKNSSRLSAISDVDKQQLLDRFLTAINAIHNVTISRKELVILCEKEFFGFIKELKKMIVAKQQDKNEALETK